jgi:hypothetical protein
MRPRASLVAALIASAILVSTGADDRSALAQETPPAPPADVWTARSPDVARAAATRLWKSGEEAKSAQLFEFAVRVARRVVALDPEHKAARAVLGQSKKDGAWADDPDLVAKTPRRNFPAKAPAPEEGAAIEKKWAKDHAAARAGAAAVWTTFAEECAKKGDAKSAERAHRAALDLDPDQQKSRTALGYYRWQGAWLTEAQVRAVEAASKAETVEGESAFEGPLGVKLTKVQSAHFRIESRIPADRLKELARWLEVAYAVHLAELGRDPTSQVFPSQVRFVLCENDAEWNRWIDGFVRRDKEFMRKLEGVWADPPPGKERGNDWSYGMKPPADGSDETRRDHLVHRAMHAMDSFVLGLFWPHWADEGLAHVLTIRVQGMTRTWCVGPTTSDYAKLDRNKAGGAGWIDEAEWRATVRAAVLAHDDLPLRTLVLQPISELGFQGTLKAWSTLDWWRREEPEALRALLAKFRGAKPDAAAAAIEAHFGKGLEEIDDAWRRWVLRTY